MKITCEKCGATLAAPENAVGKNVRCPKCKHAFMIEALELTEDIGERRPSPASNLAGLAAEAQWSTPPGPPAPAGVAAQPQSPVIVAPQRRCARCGYQGYMRRKSSTLIIVLAILFFPIGLLLLLIKEPRCPQCGSSFE